MTTNQHGGSRPATRPDDGRRNNKHGSPGRKPQSFTVKVGDRLYVAAKNAEGEGIHPAQLWTVTEIERTHVVMSSDSGDTYRLVR